MDAVILAGGQGTRLKSIISEIPKPLAPIGDKAFLEYLFSHLIRHEISRIILSVGYMQEKIIQKFGSNYCNMDIIYSVEDEPLGTGGAIKKAQDIVLSDSFFILNGDSFFEVNLLNMKQHHLSENADITIALKLMHDFDRYGSVEINGAGNIISFHEKKPTSTGFINGGVYIIKKNIFSKYSLPKKFSIESFLQENCLSLNIKSFISDGYFIDIGIPSDYCKAKGILPNLLNH